LTAEPEISTNISVALPPLNRPTKDNPDHGEDFEDFAVETHEWLSMISLDSPRICPEDKIDPFLSRYAPPGDPSNTSKLVKIVWRGFLAPTWAHIAFVEALLAVPRDAWFALCVVGFREGWSGESRDCTILKPRNAPNEYVLWEIAQ
jgi:ribonuclease P/MRP protein subunit RPP40